MGVCLSPHRAWMRAFTRCCFQACETWGISKHHVPVTQKHVWTTYQVLIGMNGSGDPDGRGSLARLRRLIGAACMGAHDSGIRPEPSAMRGVVRRSEVHGSIR